jgi:hypothetical protein
MGSYRFSSESDWIPIGSNKDPIRCDTRIDRPGDLKIFDLIYNELIEHGFIKKGIDEKKQRCRFLDLPSNVGTNNKIG